MKTVYVDVVFAVNFCTDYLLLYLTSSFLHIKVNIIRMVLASVVGSLFSLMAAIIVMPPFLRIVISFALAILMCLFAFGRKRPKIFVKIIASMLGFSVMLAGLLLMFVTDMSQDTYNAICIVAFSMLFAYALPKIIRVFRSDLFSHKVMVKIEYMGKKVECLCLCDSGNMLCDPYLGFPVILLDGSFREKLIGIDEYYKLRLIPTVSINGKGFVEAVTPEKVYVCLKKEIRVNAAVGFVSSGLVLPDGCNGIIPTALFEGY